MPVRIQRRRTKGWKMPPNTVYVGRPSKWGNPWSASHHDHEHHPSIPFVPPSDEAQSREEAVAKFRAYAVSLDLTELRGKNLACWCHSNWPCHAGVLLELANAEVPFQEHDGAPRPISGAKEKSDD